MIRALVCDFGGVLTSPIEEGFHAYEAASGVTLERLGDDLRFEDCLFVDDLEHNCEAARQLGMSAVRFQDAEQAIAEINALLG